MVPNGQSLSSLLRDARTESGRGDALGSVCHYTHLNPVRAGLVEVAALEQYKDSRFANLWHPSRRSEFESPEVALEFAGGLADSRVGRRKYREYLDWLA